MVPPFSHILRGWLDRIHIATSATGVAARRERGKMPKAASDRVNNEADAPVPPSGWVVYPAVPSVQQADGSKLDKFFFSPLSGGMEQ